MNPKDYEDYKKNNVKASKSQLKEYIQIYADMAKKLKSEDAPELEAVKTNIKKTYPEEIYFTLIDEADKFVKLTLTETSREYIIPVFTDIREYALGSAKISKLFLDKLEMKVITPEDISSLEEYEKGFEYLKLADYEPCEVSDELFSELAKNDDAFSGIILDIHSQNITISKEELI